jgi:hypothetical protein
MYPYMYIERTNRVLLMCNISLREKQALPCEPLDGKEAYTHGKGFAVRARTA